jgi:protein involved in polysaccharide export with SLBB domain
MYRQVLRPRPTGLLVWLVAAAAVLSGRPLRGQTALGQTAFGQAAIGPTADSIAPPAAPSADSVAPSAAPATETVASSIDTLGALRAGDLVRLRIWREPDLSGEFSITEQGDVVLPKVGLVRLAGSPDAVKADLVKRYGAYLKNPSIDVTVLRRVNVMGAVRNPGLYNVDPTMRVADALAMAGGVDEDGKPDDVRLIRGGQPVDVKMSEHTLLTNTPLRSGDQLFVPQRSWVNRSRGVIAAFITAGTSLLIVMLKK